MTQAETVREHLDTLRGADYIARCHAVTFIRWATEGWLIEGDRIVGEVVEPSAVDPVWHGSEVVEALVTVCSDPKESAAMWTEAAEALAYIWKDTGGADPRLLERLTPEARSQVISEMG